MAFSLQEINQNPCGHPACFRSFYFWPLRQGRLPSKYPRKPLASKGQNVVQYQTTSKPKGNCDLPYQQSSSSPTNRTKRHQSRKAIVTLDGLKTEMREELGTKRHQSRKAIVTLQPGSQSDEHRHEYQTTSKPKGNCDCVPICSRRQSEQVVPNDIKAERQL